MLTTYFLNNKFIHIENRFAKIIMVISLKSMAVGLVKGLCLLGKQKTYNIKLNHVG